jgi:hypothetical protein
MNAGVDAGLVFFPQKVFNFSVFFLGWIMALSFLHPSLLVFCYWTNVREVDQEDGKGRSKNKPKNGSSVFVFAHAFTTALRGSKGYKEWNNRYSFQWDISRRQIPKILEKSRQIIDRESNGCQQ